MFVDILKQTHAVWGIFTLWFFFSFGCPEHWYQYFYWSYSTHKQLCALISSRQVYGKRAPWEDPTEWAMQTYPWSNLGCERQLLPIRSEDVGYDTVAPPTSAPVGQVDVTSNKKTPSPAGKEEHVISAESSDPLVRLQASVFTCVGDGIFCFWQRHSLDSFVVWSASSLGNLLSRVESYQWLESWYSSGYPARCLALSGRC